MTENELKCFKRALQKNGITCNETPRTEEELANLICVFNIKEHTFAIQPKEYILSKEEVFIPVKGLYENYISLKANKDTDSKNGGNLEL